MYPPPNKRRPTLSIHPPPTPNPPPTHHPTTNQTHGFPKVMGVVTHLDALRNNKALNKTKKRLKQRFWTEIYDVRCLSLCVVYCCSSLPSPCARTPKHPHTDRPPRRTPTQHTHTHTYTNTGRQDVLPLRDRQPQVPQKRGPYIFYVCVCIYIVCLCVCVYLYLPRGTVNHICVFIYTSVCHTIHNTHPPISPSPSQPMPTHRPINPPPDPQHHALRLPPQVPPAHVAQHAPLRAGGPLRGRDPARAAPGRAPGTYLGLVGCFVCHRLWSRLVVLLLHLHPSWYIYIRTPHT